MQYIECVCAYAPRTKAHAAFILLPVLRLIIGSGQECRTFPPSRLLLLLLLLPPWRQAEYRITVRGSSGASLLRQRGCNFLVGQFRLHRLFSSSTACTLRLRCRSLFESKLRCLMCSRRRPSTRFNSACSSDCCCLRNCASFRKIFLFSVSTLAPPSHPHPLDFLRLRVVLLSRQHFVAHASLAALWSTLAGVS